MTPGDYPDNIWITGPLAKVLENTGAPGSVHWAVVYTTRNEIQSFQVHVQAAASPINALSVRLSDLVNAQTGTRISAASTDIVVYREAYENVTIPTASGATFLNTTGPIPDILIPAVDPYFHQTTKAFPFTVVAGNNQSVWVDVHTPPTAPAGYYSGTVTVMDGAAVLAAMPVVYAVWNWEMPSTASLPSFTVASYGGFCVQVYGPAAGCGTYPSAQGNGDLGAMLADVDAAVQMLDNRYTLAGPGIDVFPASGSFATFTSIYGCLLSGTPCTNTSSILKGARATSWNMTPLPTQITQATFQNYQNVFTANGWVEPLYFLADEPGGNTALWASMVVAAQVEHGFGVSIPTASTADLPTATANNAQNLVDRLIVNMVALEPAGPGAVPESIASYQAWIAAAPSGLPPRSFWNYQACSNSGTCTNGVPGPTPGGYPNTYPNYNVDGTPVANRLVEWMTYLHGQTGELYYYIDVCDGPGGVCGVGAPGVSMSPGNPLISNYYAGGWGDGTLMYPGSSTYLGTAKPIWLPSMRLKMIRDGMQDYEYLNELTKAGYASFAAQQLQSFITNSYTFNNDPAALEAARQALGNKLHELSFAPHSRKIEE